MSSRKPSVLATNAALPVLHFAEAVEHATQLLGRRLKTAPQMAAVLEIDDPFLLFANWGPEAAAALHDELHGRLSRRMDRVIAIGAFRFVVMSCATSEPQARQLARDAMEATSLPVQIGGSMAVITAVAGAVFLDMNGDAAAALQRTAVALNEARRRGRRLLMAHDVMDGHQASPSFLADRMDQLDHALRNDRLRLAFQPVLDASTREVVHHEALLRVIGEEGSVSSAAPLIAAAETLDLSYRVDEAVLDMAADHLLRHPALKLAINISAASARDATQGRAWLDQLSALGDDVRRVTVELTETAAPDDVSGVLAGFAAEVQRMGASFSIDDFGVGYTSYSNLLALRPDEVKIDGCFAQAVRSDRRSAAFIKAVVTLAKDLGIRTVAEWVENAEDADALTVIGVDALQGFYFGVPAVSARPDQALKRRA